jgi:hypothetical protein
MNADERRQVREIRLAGKVPILERYRVTCPQVWSRNCKYGIFYFLDVCAVRWRPEFTETVGRVTLTANGDVVPFGE